MRSGAGCWGAYPGGTWTVTGRSPPTTTSAVPDATGEADGPLGTVAAAEGTAASDAAADPLEVPAGAGEAPPPHPANRKPTVTRVRLRRRAMARQSIRPDSLRGDRQGDVSLGSESGGGRPGSDGGGSTRLRGSGRRHGITFGCRLMDTRVPIVEDALDLRRNAERRTPFPVEAALAESVVASVAASSGPHVAAASCALGDEDRDRDQQQRPQAGTAAALVVVHVVIRFD